jgi:hypothetical protein
MRICFYIFFLFFSSLSFAGFTPLHDKKAEGIALDALEVHLKEEGLNREDAETALAYIDGRTKVFFFLIREHGEDGEELYRVNCIKDKCRFKYN